VVSYFLRYFSSTSTEQISGFRRTFHQFRSAWLCYFCYSRAGRLVAAPKSARAVFYGPGRKRSWKKPKMNKKPAPLPQGAQGGERWPAMTTEGVQPDRKLR
jgi:hypothetical protein